MPESDRYYMGEALKEARRALRRGDFPVGCVMASAGGVLVRAGRRGSAADGGSELEHAEMIALRRLSRLDPAFDPAGITVYCTLEPCLMCFGALMLHGLGTIVYAYEDVMGGATGCDRSRLAPLYRDFRLTLRGGVRRGESLALFKRFFADPANGYWRGSLLARHALEQ